MEDLSPRSLKIVNAMNLTMGIRFNAVDTQLQTTNKGMGQLQEAMSGLTTRVSDVEKTVGGQNERMTKLEEKMEKLEQGGERFSAPLWRSHGVYGVWRYTLSITGQLYGGDLVYGRNTRMVYGV